VARPYDVVVVGAGPAGAACAFWLADAGFDVLVVERKRFPRDKTCGDGLTPRAVRQLEDMGLGGSLVRFHRCEGLVASGFGRSVRLSWPQHPEFPSYGLVVPRRELDGLVASAAEAAGATLWQGAEATEPILEGGVAAGVLVGPPGEPDRAVPVRSRYLVVADGANSRLGRALGAARDRRLPFGLAIRGYLASPRHAEPTLRSFLDLADADGATVPGYGWAFPMGDGRLNVGVGLLTTAARWKGLNTTRLYEAFVERAAAELDAGAACGPPSGGKLPMGLAVGPRVGPRHLLVGDAAGAGNPFNGEGIAYAYETGRLAAFALGRALATGDPGALWSYEALLEEAYAEYFALADRFVGAIGHPAVMAAAVRYGLRSEELMEGLLRVMANLMRPEDPGVAEAAYRLAAASTAKVASAASRVRSMSASVWARLGKATS
jgi:geranylgeranyl reductase family protein